MPATIATRMPTIRCTRVALVSPENATSHGAMATQIPSARLIHSSHSANAVIAAMASAPIAKPQSHAFQLAADSDVKPKIHGVRNNQAPRARLTTSASASFLHMSLINGLLCLKTYRPHCPGGGLPIQSPILDQRLDRNLETT